MTKTLFMIHGMWGTSRDWDNFLPYFKAQGYRCIATTLPYHNVTQGGSPDPRLGTTSLLDYADALVQQIQQLDEKPVILGHSMGGLLAQMLGARGLAQSLVLLCPAAPAGSFVLTPAVVRSFWRYALRWGFWKRPYRQPFSDAAWSSLNLLAPEAQREAHSKYVWESGRVIFEIGGWPLYRGHANAVDASRIHCPMLVVSGGQDRITPASSVRKVAEKYRHVSTYREFPDHAHWMLGEPKWEQVAEFISDWVNQAT